MILSYSKTFKAKKSLDVISWDNMYNENNIELKDINFCYGAEDIEYNKGVISFLENLHKNNIFNYVLSNKYYNLLQILRNKLLQTIASNLQ